MTKVCEKCEGDGYIELIFMGHCQDVKCDKCNGTGRVKNES